MSGGTAALEVVDGQLLRHDKQHTMLSGAIHYFRVHPDYWRDRLMRLRALGLNTIDTYIAWNFHQAQADSPADFTGWRDFEEFIRIAGDIGLDVVVRPGPYICAEWDNGGFPAWATARCPGTLRTSDPRFLQLVSTWFDELIPRIAALQTGNGGPVVAVQIENEYGSFGDDQAYLRWLRDALSQRGITELMFTADGPTELMLDGGMLAGSFAAMTLGSRPDRALELLRERRADQPMLVAEFWQGWFDHWGELHHVRTARSALCTLREILEAGGSVCLYMAHGGTNFGLRSGANHDGTVLQPTVTSYDSDAPVAESGALTSKFHDYRALFEEYAAAPLPALPAEPEVLPGRVLPLQPGMPLLDSLRSASSVVESVTPRSFEDLALDAGMLLYEAEPLIPQHGCDLNVTGLHDRATVFVDDEPVGVIDTENGSLRIPGPGRRVRLSLLVENLGRINYGPLLGQGKGILGPVQLDYRAIQHWQQRALPLDRWGAPELDRIAHAALELDAVGDTFVALPGCEKGFVWVNGFLLGRYWSKGPQETLYLPAPLLRTGINTLSVLELGRLGTVVALREAASLGEAQEYVEQLPSPTVSGAGGAAGPH
ncbi:glycoside hydrolase family 35 protein [Rudaeicoccus suwonensis]|uniref:Beta-galactosidase n=1 Tax=Rudaeicoccus suwonensis TaxID=657409 RepID=A0A561E0Y9_9MICO|nr:beta-galactosidase family protein [Rudaeicoccus suwonensis]TWE09269.1 beta-galactosidase [Rudaeicoccus suwonensis]